MTVRYYGGLSSQRQVLRRKLEKMNHPVIRREKARFKRKNAARAMSSYVKMALKGQDPTKMHLSRSNMKRAKKAKRLVEKHMKRTKITVKQKVARRKNIAIARGQRKRRKRK